MTLHFAQLSGTLICIRSRYVRRINDCRVPPESIGGIGKSHEISSRPFTTPTYPVPLLFLLPLTSLLSLRIVGAPLQK